ncbi:MAG: hypothetical protein NTV43_15295 [Methylococcales bacterium]|nr:hypothetical protein [Methylococcales bacterium]
MPSNSFYFGLIALVISIASGMVLSTVKDAEKRMKEQMDDIKKQLDMQKKLTEMQQLHDKVMLIAISTKYGSYYDQKLLSGRQDPKTSLYNMLVKLFRADVDNTVLLHSELEAISQCPTRLVALPIHDAENIHAYLEMLSAYHRDNNPELSKLCLVIRHGG